MNKFELNVVSANLVFCLVTFVDYSCFLFVLIDLCLVEGPVSIGSVVC